MGRRLLPRIERIIPPVRRKAIRLLRKPDFFGEIRKAMRREGLATGFGGATLTYLATVSASLETPLNLILAGSSSADTDFFAGRVLRLVPPEAITSTAEDGREFRSDNTMRKVLFLHGDRSGAGFSHLVLTRKALLALRFEGHKRVKHLVAKRPFATIATSTVSLRISEGIPYTSAWIGSPEQKRPAQDETGAKLSALSEQEFAVWHEVYRLLSQRCSWIFFPPDWFELIRGLAPTRLCTLRRFPSLMETMKMSAIVRSFRDPLIGGYPEWPYFINVDFADYAIAATLINAVDDEARNTIAARSCESDIGKIARSDRTAKSSPKLLQHEDLIKNSPGTRPIDFVHPLTGELVTLSPRREQIGP